MVNPTLGGIIAAGISILTFGTFSVPLKARAVVAARVDPLVYQLYVSTVIFATGWFSLLVKPFVFTWYGLASAALWVHSAVLAIFAVRLVGISVAQSVWSASTIVVSFLWGALYFHDRVKSLPLALLGLAMLLGGIVGISAAMSPAPAGRARVESIQSRPEDRSSPTQTPFLQRQNGDSSESSGSAAPAAVAPPSPRSKAAGIAVALLIGVLNGSVLVPMKLAPEHVQGMSFVPSQSIGIMAVTPLVALAYFVARRLPCAAALGRWVDMPGPVAGPGPAAAEPLVPPLHFASVFPWGAVAGALWTVGNVCSIVASNSPLGLTVGYPLTQCSLLVGASWGVFYFREITAASRRALFFLSALVLIGGAALLAVGG